MHSAQELQRSRNERIIDRPIGNPSHRGLGDELIQSLLGLSYARVWPNRYVIQAYSLQKGLDCSISSDVDLQTSHLLLYSYSYSPSGKGSKSAVRPI